jgi:hypothetical protein
MRKSGFWRFVVAASLVGTLGATLTATPAMAGVATSFRFNHVKASYDDNPGDGAGSWAWGFNDGDQSALLYIHVVTDLKVLVIPPHTSRTAEFDKDIANMMVCDGTGCSGWH